MMRMKGLGTTAAVLILHISAGWAQADVGNAGQVDNVIGHPDTATNLQTSGLAPLPTDPIYIDTQTDAYRAIDAGSLKQQTIALSDAVETDEEAADFLLQATFGPTRDSIAELRNLGYSEWFRRQVSLPVDEHLDEAAAQEAIHGSNRSAERFTMNSWYEKAVTGPDQLRQVTTFALSQILATSTLQSIRKSQMHARFKDILQYNSFGNYRDLLQEVTYSPLMGEWLTYTGNEKANPETGSVPDENYAREILQLFTIGLVELELTGRPRLHKGEQIETYDNSDITELAKVFTGLYWANTSFHGHVAGSSRPNQDLPPMEMHNEFHSEGPKTFLGHTIPEYEDGNQTISDALDIIFDHPNVAPFIAKALIQRMVTSNPGASYVTTVSNAFNAGTYTLPDGDTVGSGSRGDLMATVAAVLFSVNARTPARFTNTEFGRNFGRVRDPATRIVHWMRVSEVEGFDAAQSYFFNNGVQPFRSPSVFNFYRPGFVASNTESGDKNLVAPELQIYGGPNFFAFFDAMRGLVSRTASNFDFYLPQYSYLLSLAEDADALTDYFNLVYTANRMAPATRQSIFDFLESVPVTGSTSEQNEAKRTRVMLATLLSVSSVEFTVGR